MFSYMKEINSKQHCPYVHNLCHKIIVELFVIVLLEILQPSVS